MYKRQVYEDVFDSYTMDLNTFKGQLQARLSEYNENEEGTVYYICLLYTSSKIAWLFLPCVLLLASCGKRQVTKSATVEAQQTAGKIRQGWATACRPLTIT